MSVERAARRASRRLIEAVDMSGPWELWLAVVLDVLQGSFNNVVDDDDDDHGLLWHPKLNREGT